MSKAQQLVTQRFDYGVPRSAEYQAGCLYILQRKLEDGEAIFCPYGIPSAQADAWFAGCDEGHRMFAAYLEAHA
ncbi:hypothetical protein [Pseudomonas paralcaligenes]|uniref:hypothetical protein n=1 Tax=Pseudomonas paralcaligenes TaxID=2772558 RepID=UPI001C80F0B7|nr:hypothetical protein [Pseudomonas paralcaligenes]